MGRTIYLCDAQTRTLYYHSNVALLLKHYRLNKKG